MSLQWSWHEVSATNVNKKIPKRRCTCSLMFILHPFFGFLIRFLDPDPPSTMMQKSGEPLNGGSDWGTSDCLPPRPRFLGLYFADPKSASLWLKTPCLTVDIFRPWVCGSCPRTSSLGMNYAICKSQVLGSSIQSLNFRPQVSSLDFQYRPKTWGLNIWTLDLRYGYFAQDLKSEVMNHL